MKAAAHILGHISKSLTVRLRNFLLLGILRPHMKYCIQFSPPQYKNRHTGTKAAKGPSKGQG